MTFEHLKNKEILLNVKEETGEKNAIIIKPIGNDPWESPKFKIDLESYNQGVRFSKGFIYFYVDIEKCLSSFIGMKIEPEFRRRSYSNLLVSSYIDACHYYGINHLNTNKKQRKPELIHVLKKFGYEATSFEPMKEINIIDTEHEQNTFYIPIESTRIGCLKSRLFKDNNYKVLDSLEGQSIIDTVYINQEYVLNNNEKCLRKQMQIKSQFEIR